MHRFLSVGCTAIPAPSNGFGSQAPYGPGCSGTVVQGGSNVTGFPLGAGFLSGGLFEVLALLFTLGIVAALVIVVVANRADPDPSGNRPRSVYFFGVSFVTLILAVIASVAMVIGLALLIGHHGNSITNDVARVEVAGGLLCLLSTMLLLRHLRMGLSLALGPDGASTPSKRVGQSYVGVVSFVMVLLLIPSSVLAVYVIFSLVAPGVFGSFGGRADAARVLIVALYIAAVAVIILITHRNLVPPRLDARVGLWQQPGDPSSSALGAPPSPPR